MSLVADEAHGTAVLGFEPELDRVKQSCQRAGRDGEKISGHFGEVDDLDALIVRILAAGGVMQGDVQEEPYGRFAWLVDPDGTKIELWQHQAGAA